MKKINLINIEIGTKVLIGGDWYIYCHEENGKKKKKEMKNSTEMVRQECTPSQQTRLQNDGLPRRMLIFEFFYNTGNTTRNIIFHDKNDDILQSNQNEPRRKKNKIWLNQSTRKTRKNWRSFNI